MGGTLNIPDEPKEHDVFKGAKETVAPNIDKQKLQGMGLSSRDADRIIGGNGPGGGMRVGSGDNSGELHEEFNWQSIRPLWSSYPDYKEVEYNNKKYAEIAGRLYRAHAITRMLPRGLGPAAGEQGKKDNSGTKNRSVPAHIVEHAIRYGEKVKTFESDEPGGEMVRYGDVDVIIYDGGRIVDTVIVNK